MPNGANPRLFKFLGPTDAAAALLAGGGLRTHALCKLGLSHVPGWPADADLAPGLLRDGCIVVEAQHSDKM